MSKVKSVTIKGDPPPITMFGNGGSNIEPARRWSVYAENDTEYYIRRRAWWLLWLGWEYEAIEKNSPQIVEIHGVC